MLKDKRKALIPCGARPQGSLLAWAWLSGPLRRRRGRLCQSLQRYAPSEKVQDVRVRDVQRISILTSIHVHMYTHIQYVPIYGSGSKTKVCNSAGARYIGYVEGRRLSRQTQLALLFVVILSRATSGDKGNVTSPAFHTFVTEGRWRLARGFDLLPY